MFSPQNNGIFLFLKAIPNQELIHNMSTNPATRFSYSPAVQCLIPLFYAAWADQVLTPSETEGLKQKGIKLSFLNDAERLQLTGWSNPAIPPSRQLFKYWEIQIKQVAEGMVSLRPTLIDLGLEMAKNAARLPQYQDSTINWESPLIRKELEELENDLQSVGIDTYLNIFPETGRLPEQEDQQLEEALHQLLDKDYQALRQRLRTILQDPALKYKTLRQKEDYRQQVLEWCKMLAAQGLGSLSYPKAYGGQGDIGAYATTFEMLGYHDLSLAVKFGVQFGLFGGSVMALGTKIHHDRYLEAIGKLELPGCFAMTETGHGSNVRDLETTATYDADSDTFVVHSPNEEAGKEYIGNALHGRMATVFAQLIVNGENHGVHALLVPLRDTQHRLMPGIRIEDCGYKLGLNGVDNGRIWFDNVRIPRTNLLNRYGDVNENGQYSSPIENPSRRFFTMLGTLVSGRVGVPRAGISAAKSGLTIAIRYALKRRQFAPKPHAPETLLLDYPSHQRRLLPLLAKAYALDFALKHLSQVYVQREDGDIREIETMAAGLKAYSTWFTTKTLQECREACGGKGYLSENRFADLKADTDIFTTFEGDNTVLMQLVAKAVLSEFRKEFHEDGNMAILRYLAGRVTTAITELNPFIIRNTDKSHLLSTEFHLSAVRFRERRTLYSLANRMQAHIKEGLSSYEVLLKCQTHLLALAEAYVERLVLEQFVKVVENLDDSLAKNALNDLYILFALSTIEQHKGWYLENDFLSGSKSKAIRSVIDEWCGKVREKAAIYVGAFGIPDSLLAAEIIQKS